MFRLSIWPLLPVSMAETPFIMMLFSSCVSPIRETPPVCPDSTPGVKATAFMKFEWPIGMLSICNLFDSDRALTALGLYESSLRLYRNRFGGSAYFERYGRDAHAISAGNQDTPYSRDLERRGADLDGVRIRRNIREHVVPLFCWS